MSATSITRDKIRQALSDNPGIHQQRLAVLLELHPNTVSKHVAAIRAESQAKDAGQ